MGSAASLSPPFYATRRAHHAGSWYEDTSSDLNESLQRFLDQVVETPSTTATTTTTSSDSSSLRRRHSNGPLRGLIVPHAGYSYSGATAAYSYQALREELLLRSSIIRYILVLHPSHHVYLENCAVSGARELQTPLGSLRVADDLRQEILALSTSSSLPFTVMNQKTDEEEHSGEMQYPYIAKVLRDIITQQQKSGGDNSNNGSSSLLSSISVLPVMCGALQPHQEEAYGKMLAPIIARRDVITIVSTDFCHWGQRFRYQPVPSTTTTTTAPSMEIFEHIQAMDRQGMDHIEMQQPGAFVKYLQQTRNTICGRHAVAVWLYAIRHNRETGRQITSIDFIHYAQSSSVRSMMDSSVSYASAVARLEEDNNDNTNTK